MENLTDKIEKAMPPSLAIDGATIKNIRETKKLTQLYVASVVGVTTDTISRWENNRYPSIKRENAEKLATALEVPLEDILKREAPEPVQEATETPAPEKPKRHYGIVIAVVVVLAVAAAFYLVPMLTAPPMAVRWAPRYAAPGQLLPVQIIVNRRDNAGRGLIIKEKLPAGWRVVSARPPVASGRASSEELKWLIPGGSASVKLSYVVQVPQGTPMQTTAELRGTILLDRGGINRAETIGGTRQITVGPYHWADANGDGRIDDNEIMPAYYLTEEMKTLGLDWTTIESIWSGKGYRWDQSRSVFEVLK